MPDALYAVAAGIAGLFIPGIQIERLTSAGLPGSIATRDDAKIRPERYIGSRYGGPRRCAPTVADAFARAVLVEGIHRHTRLIRHHSDFANACRDSIAALVIAATAAVLQCFESCVVRILDTPDHLRDSE